MDSTADALKLSYKDNPELKAALGDAKPGDQIELCVTVTVRSNDEDTFDALIDEVEPMSEDAYEDAYEADEDEEKEPSLSDEPDDAGEKKPSAVLMVMAGKKKADAKS
jgi:hypothetical protein